MSSRSTLTDLLAAVEVGDLVPERYAPYRPLVRDGLAFFLGRLPAARQAEVVARQLALPEAAPPARRVLEVLRCSPTLHKLGQILARDRRLDPELRGFLQELESMPSSFGIEEARRMLAQHRKEGTELLGPPLAEASVALVVPYRSRRRRDQPTEGVLKLLKPGIEVRLEEDLATWDELGGFLQHESHRQGLYLIDWSEILEEVRDLLLHEVDLRSEQRNLEAARRFYRDSDEVEVPRLLPECGPRVTAMTRVRGPKVHLVSGSSRRREVARAIVSSLVSRPLFSTEEPVLFHGDPHAGNLVWTSDERLGLLDWALAGRIEQRSVNETVRILFASLRLDARAIARALEDLAVEVPDRALLEDVVHRSLRQLRWGGLPGLGWLLSLLDQSALDARVRFAPNLFLFRKSLLTLDGVVRDLVGTYSLSADLLLAGVRHLVTEWPSRLVASPTSRAFPTHLSNLDLLSLLWWAPARARNFWREALADTSTPPRTRRVSYSSA